MCHFYLCLPLVVAIYVGEAVLGGGGGASGRAPVRDAAGGGVHVADARVRRNSLLRRGRPAEDGDARSGDGGGAGSKVVPTDLARAGICAQQGE